MKSVIIVNMYEFMMEVFLVFVLFIVRFVVFNIYLCCFKIF